MRFERSLFFLPGCASKRSSRSVSSRLHPTRGSRGRRHEIVAEGVPVGLARRSPQNSTATSPGSMGINAVKGSRSGGPLRGGAQREEHAEKFVMGNDGSRFFSNHAGGILGGISTGQPIVLQFSRQADLVILTPRRPSIATAPTEITPRDGMTAPASVIRACRSADANGGSVSPTLSCVTRGQMGETLGWPFAVPDGVGQNVLDDHHTL